MKVVKISGKNVYEQALERIEYLFNNFDEVIVGCSGGKDSTVCLELTLMVAKKLNRLPVKVFWLDQEAEWQETVDYMNWVMHRPEVKPYWYQFPFDFTNSASGQNNFVRLWDESKKDLWIHDQSDIAIKVNPTGKNRFHDIMDGINRCMMEDSSKMVAYISGVRVEENVRRRYMIGNCEYGFISKSKEQEKRRFRRAFPIGNWTTTDVWTAIAKNKWRYNTIYDKMYQIGYNTKQMRVSALIHETSWKALNIAQEIEPQTYKRIVARIHGASSITHMNDIDVELLPKELPYMFKDWREYRDYLLIHLVKQEYWELFKHRWKGQNSEKWYKIHCKECVINDIDGTINTNAERANEYAKKCEELKNDKRTTNK